MRADTAIRRYLHARGFGPVDLRAVAFNADNRPVLWNVIDASTGKTLMRDVSGAEDCEAMVAAGTRVLIVLANKLGITPEECADAYRSGRLVIDHVEVR